MKRKILLALGIFLLLGVFLFFAIPMLLSRVGIEPVQTESIGYTSSTLGVTILYPLNEDSKWTWTEGETQYEGGNFLKLRHRENDSKIMFVYLPAPPGDLEMSMKNNRSGTGYFSNMEYTARSIRGETWVVELSDYDREGRTFKFYTAAIKHRNRMIIMEAQADPKVFSGMVAEFEAIHGAIDLH
jgi:hypothetical protein